MLAVPFLIYMTVLDFDEINDLTDASVHLSGSVDELIDKVETILILAYQNGFDAVEEMLECDLAYDIEQMQRAIFDPIEGKTFADRVADHVRNEDQDALRRLVENEAHRVSNIAGYDCAAAYGKTGGRVEKGWVTMGDDRVRDTHDYIDGRWVGLRDEFWTYDGDHAQYPGGFAYPENNIGCRCWLVYRRV